MFVLQVQSRLQTKFHPTHPCTETAVVPECDGGGWGALWAGRHPHALPPGDAAPSSALWHRAGESPQPEVRLGPCSLFHICTIEMVVGIQISDWNDDILQMLKINVVNEKWVIHWFGQVMEATVHCFCHQLAVQVLDGCRQRPEDNDWFIVLTH